MCPILTCLALATVGGGVDCGYRPASGGKTLELIVQMDPMAFRTLGPGDSISAVVPAEAQKYPVSKITAAVESGPPPRKLPQPTAALSSPAHRGAPATAPFVQAAPLPSSPVMVATAETPIGANGGPSFERSADPGPVRVGAPTGPVVAPRTANEQSKGAADPQAGSTLAPGNQVGNTPYPALDSVDGGKATTASFNGKELLLYLAVIGLAASNGYVGWLWYDARQRYIGLLSMKFAAAK